MIKIVRRDWPRRRHRLCAAGRHGAVRSRGRRRVSQQPYAPQSQRIEGEGASGRRTCTHDAPPPPRARRSEELTRLNPARCGQLSTARLVFVGEAISPDRV